MEPNSVSAYFSGRCRPRWLILTWIVTFLTAVLTWNGSLEIPGSPNRVLISARLTVPLAGLLVHLWLMAPAMASWEVIAVRRVRRMTAAYVLVGILLAATALIFSIWFVTSAPPAFVPGYFIGLDDLLAVQWPLVENMLVLAGTACLAVCLLGRPVGTGLTFLVYLTLVVGGGSTSWYHVFPYYSHGFGIPVTHHPIAGIVLAVAAVWMWARTGGTSPLARWLDPR